MPEAMHEPESLSARLAEVRGRIEISARRAGRPAAEVTLIAVSKTHGAALVREALSAGASDFGENRVQEAEGKIAEVASREARWHLIGHLQSNKARRAVRLFDVVHTIDSAELVARLEKLCQEEGRERLDALIQVDLGGEETKAGAPPAEVPQIVEAFASCQRLRLTGLMTLPPFFAEAERVRPFFRRLRELRDELARQGAFAAGGEERAGELSMGMSHDFEVAIEEGATLVRVGTAIFGARLKDAAR